MKVKVALFFCMVLYRMSYAGDSLVTKSIIYYSSKVSAAYLLWTLDNWQIPDTKFHPEGSFILNGMVCSKMEGEKDSFSIDLDLPKGSYINFMVWTPLNNQGDSVEGWDTNWGVNYNVYVDHKGEPTKLTDEKLGITPKAKPPPRPFNILEKGWIYLVAGILLLGISLIVHFRHRKNSLSFPAALLTGLVFSSLILMLLCRLQLTGYISHHQYLMFGLGYYDIVLILAISITSFLFIYLLRRWKYLYHFFMVITAIVLLVAAGFSVFNIEIVRQLGKPLTYDWLYYSDFLQGADARNAMKAGFSGQFIKNIIFIFTGVCCFTIAISFFYKAIFTSARRAVLTSFALLIIFFVTGFLQKKSLTIEPGKMQDPFTALLFSWIRAGDHSELFTRNVSEQTKIKIEEMHSSRVLKDLHLKDSIKNVVFFILESTPANLIQIYGSPYTVSNNISKWQKHALVYDNMYAHLPTTVNSMLSIISGVYPMISYKSMVTEYPGIGIPSLPYILENAGWKTSLFFSSDLNFAGMNKYLQNQRVQTIADFKSISCKHEAFSSNYAQLDGLDDRCIVEVYFKWRDSLSKQNSFSILWTNQTHYPYFYKDEKKLTEQTELNKYLNALEEVDQAFGELMDGLESRGELNNTLVVVMGDHGEAFGTHDQFTHGANIYEENIRIPFLIINPRFFNGQRDKNIYGMIDIAPTIAQLLGMEPPHDWEGISMLADYKRQHSFFIGPYADFQFGSRFQNWKFIYNAANGSYKLYNLASDPGELKNLAKENKSIVSEELELMAAWVQYHNKRVNEFINRKN